MPQLPLPSEKYRSHLRQILHLLDRDKVVEACDLLEKLKLDGRQFDLFVRSPAYRPFCEAVKAYQKYWRAIVKDYESALVVLAYIQEDLRPAKRASAAAVEHSGKAKVKPPTRRTRGRRR